MVRKNADAKQKYGNRFKKKIEKKKFTEKNVSSHSKMQ